MLGVLSEGRRGGWSLFGYVALPNVYYEDTTPAGLNHTAALAPTAVTQTHRSPADLLLLDITVDNI